MRALLAALCAVLMLSACDRGDAQERLSGTLRVPVRVLGPDGIELPREAANELRYALALVPAALFGMADRATLKQLTAVQTAIELDGAQLSKWAEAGAKPWLAGEGAELRIAPAGVRVARVMTAAFSPAGESRLGVGFHDLMADTNLVLVYVDRACTVAGRLGDSAGGATGEAVALDLRFPAAGLYWLRTVPGLPITVVAPASPTLEVRTR